MHDKPTLQELIQATHMTQAQLSVAAGVSVGTVNKANTSNEWPTQRRPRLALARVLGMNGDPLTETEEVAHAADSTAPARA